MYIWNTWAWQTQGPTPFVGSAIVFDMYTESIACPQLRLFLVWWDTLEIWMKVGTRNMGCLYKYAKLRVMGCTCQHTQPGNTNLESKSWYYYPGGWFTPIGPLANEVHFTCVLKNLPNSKWSSQYGPTPRTQYWWDCFTRHYFGIKFFVLMNIKLFVLMKNKCSQNEDPTSWVVLSAGWVLYFKETDQLQILKILKDSYQSCLGKLRNFHTRYHLG